LAGAVLGLLWCRASSSAVNAGAARLCEPTRAPSWLLRSLLVSFSLTAFGGNAAGQTSGVAIEYYHLDALGSVRVVTDESGNVLRGHDYRPFGEEVAVTYPNPERKLFTGQEHDSETALGLLRDQVLPGGHWAVHHRRPLGGHLDDRQSLNASAGGLAVCQAARQPGTGLARWLPTGYLVFGKLVDLTGIEPVTS
jgi:hypothetical protein